MLPCLIFEDEHLLVVNKPAGLNTHAPSPFAGEGLYDWLRHREPRWARLAIIHRLDKETSGVMVFSKTPLANRSLTEQFAQRRVRKKYLLLTDRPVPPKELVVKSCLVRAGEKYVSRPLHAGGEPAETRFLPGRGNRPPPCPVPIGWGEGGRRLGEGKIGCTGDRSSAHLQGARTRFVCMPPKPGFPFSATRFTAAHPPSASVCTLPSSH